MTAITTHANTGVLATQLAKRMLLQEGMSIRHTSDEQHKNFATPIEIVRVQGIKLTPATIKSLRQKRALGSWDFGGILEADRNICLVRQALETVCGTGAFKEAGARLNQSETEYYIDFIATRTGSLLEPLTKAGIYVTPLAAPGNRVLAGARQASRVEPELAGGVSI